MKKSKLRIYAGILPVLFIIASCGSDTKTGIPEQPEQREQLPEQEKHPELPKKPANVILMIGDGMGLTQLQAGMTAKRDKLQIARCRVIGLVKTHSADDYVTDSAASATAFATGEKTKNHFIGVDPSGNRLTNLFELAEKQGLSTGFAVTCQATHATPVAFVGHHKDRNAHEILALDFLKLDIDYFAGGGRKYFNQRKDGLNLVDSLKARGYDVVTDMESLENSASGKIAGLVYENIPPKVTGGRNDMLAVASGKALEVLSKNENGFILLIEGSQIDWAGHDNDLDYLLSEMEDFDNTVGEILDFAQKDGNTLVIITADHECGGLALPGGNRAKGEVEAVFFFYFYTAVMVPLFAYGPGAEEFMGVYENTDVFHKICKVLSISAEN